MLIQSSPTLSLCMVLLLQQDPTGDHNFIVTTCAYRTSQFSSVLACPLVYWISPIFQEVWAYCLYHKGDQLANRGWKARFQLRSWVKSSSTISYHTMYPLNLWRQPWFQADPIRGDLSPNWKTAGLFWKRPVFGISAILPFLIFLKKKQTV